MNEITVKLNLPEGFEPNITLLALTIAGVNMQAIGKNPKAYDDAHEIIKQIDEQMPKS